MTTSRKWTIGAALLIVVVLVGTWFLLVSPKRGEVSELQAATESQEGKNASLETEVALLKEQNKKLPKYQAELAELRNRIPATEGMPSLIRQLRVAADKSGVDLDALTPQPAVALVGPEGGTPAVGEGGSLPPEALAGVNFDIVVSGGYFEIQQFMNKVENLERYVQVSGFTIAEGEETTEGDTEANAGDLTATLNSRAYLVPTAVVDTEAEPLETEQ